MTHYLYKPHVHGPEFITTPDILIDRVYSAAGTTGDELELIIRDNHAINTGVEIQCALESATAAPAYFLIAAGGGVIISAGAEYKAEDSCLLLLSRFAWRLKYIKDHLDKLTFAYADNKRVGFKQFPAPEDVINRLGNNAADLPRGVMLCVTATGIAAPLGRGNSFEITLTDPVLKRELTHRIAFEDGRNDQWPRRPAGKYAVGPTSGQVKHFI